MKNLLYLLLKSSLNGERKRFLPAFRKGPCSIPERVPGTLRGMFAPFSGVFLEIDGETYRYSDHELTSAEKKDGFESYYTVKFDHVVKQNRINGDDDWYNNDEGWLDGSKAQYGAEGNDITSYHRNYIGTLRKGTRSAQTKKVLITSNWPEGKPAFRGTEIILTAELTGFKEGSYTLQWEYSTDTTPD